MRMKKFLLSLFLLSLCVSTEVSAQRNIIHLPGDMIVSVGYRPMNVGLGKMDVVEARFEYLVLDTRYDEVNVGFTGQFATGNGFYEMDFIGLIFQAAWGISVNTMASAFASGDTYMGLAAIMFGAVPMLSNLNFHFPLTDYNLEVTAGWNLLKLSKTTNPEHAYYFYETPIGEYYGANAYDKWYLNGSINAGINYYYRNIFINPYWEYNFGYFKAARFLNDNLDIGSGRYPYKGFTGNCIGLRVGYQF